MNPNRKMSSIARKIHRAWSRKLFRTYLLIDLLIIVLAFFGFCYAAERATLGAVSFDTPKRIEADDDAFDWLYWDETDRRSSLARTTDGARWQAALSTLTYRFEDASGVWHDAPMGAFLDAFGAAFQYLLWVELIVWLFSRLFGGGSARRALKPLARMSESAQQLTAKRPVESAPLAVDRVQSPDRAQGVDRVQSADKIHGFDRAPGADRLHNLEDAIGSIEPERYGVRLSTGNEELKGLEEAVNKLLDRMQAAYREQARFVSDASHELRTPIAVIQGYASMLDRWGKTDESILDESIAAIKSESEHMKALVEQLLFLARGDSGRQATAFEPFDLADVMCEVFEESEMIDSAHDWRLDAPEPVPCVGDEAMVKQAARILTDNAAKYTPPGGLIVLRAFKMGGACAFSVQDSGQGIATEDIPHIFERFYRADPARTGIDKSARPGSSGTGLGLPIAEWIIKRHGGYFEVRSWPELGTRFTAFLPERTPGA